MTFDSIPAMHCSSSSPEGGSAGPQQRPAALASDAADRRVREAARSGMAQAKRGLEGMQQMMQQMMQMRCGGGGATH